MDIWSLGCILYELLVGEKLFDGKTAEEKKDNVLKGITLKSSELSNEVLHLLNKMIKQNPKDRISIKECFDHCWINRDKLNEEQIKEHLLLSASTDQSSKSGALKTEGVINNPKLKISNFISTKNTFNINLSKLYEDKEFNFNDYLRNRDSSRITNKKSASGMITKLSSIKNVSLFDINYTIVKNNGKFQSFLQPIGFSKEQKKQNERIIDLFYKDKNKEQNEKVEKQEKNDKRKRFPSNFQHKSNNKLFPDLNLNSLIAQNTPIQSIQVSVKNKSNSIINSLQIKQPTFKLEKVKEAKDFKSTKAINTEYSNSNRKPASKRN